MLTQREYNKIIHDWIVLLTGLNGSNVRPQKNEFGFNLTNADGSPLDFSDNLCMFYIGFSNRDVDKSFDGDVVTTLKNANVTVTFIGDSADINLNKLQSLCKGNTSRYYLRTFGFAIEGEPNEIINDKEYSSKWFYRRTVNITLNTVFEFEPSQTLLNDLIQQVPLNIDGIASFVDQSIKFETVTIFPSETQQIFFPTEGKIIEKVIAEPMLLQSKTATPSNEEQLIQSDEGYDALKSVLITALDPDYIDTSNGTATDRDIILGKVAYSQGQELVGTIETYNAEEITSNQTLETDGKVVEGNILINVQPTLQAKTATVIENGTVIYTPDVGYDGLSSVEVITNVGGSLTNKLAQVVDGSVTTLSASDLQGATSVRPSCFSNMTTITSVELPNTVVTIDINAFSYCTNLNISSLPNSLISIGNSAFRNCTSLALTSLPNSITDIYNYSFSGCTNLALTSLSDGLTTINEGVFGGCTNLALTSLPSGLIRIAIGAFRDCKNLALTSLPSGVTSIEIYAFQGCTNLALTSLPNSITDIYNYSFSGCTNLALTSLPNGVTRIGNSAFQSCINLPLTSLPNSLTSIESSAFRECTNLPLNTLSNSLTSIGSTAFINCTNLEITTIPSSVTSIGSSAFRNCKGLTSITYEGQAPNISSDLFLLCSNIMLYDFSNCTTIPSLSSSRSLGHATGCQIVVPDNLYDNWIIATNWSALTDVVWVKASDYVA